ncbi:hypothetical protein [Neptuniibacter sp.]|uniref:hypothetical protein n=1 Tax=Neptuniibacter sp. TaxID=1962643 RepID=UPI00260FEFE0|nr:hypothetical protein [Neptuniibacter sp.]MCP4597830.1 hypothetical protein [Neptuniibacter sp.]
MKSNFAQFISDMNDQELEQYAEQCVTTRRYISEQLVPGKKVPRQELMSRLIENSKGQVARDDLLDHFYPEGRFRSAQSA